MDRASALITFLHVSELETSAAFYEEALGLSVAVDQGDCRIYRVADSGYLGICERPGQVSPEGIIITLVVDDVALLHRHLVALGTIVDSEPEHNEHYGIQHAFYRDPDGYLVEIQRFDDPKWASSDQASTDSESSR